MKFISNSITFSPFTFTVHLNLRGTYTYVYYNITIVYFYDTIQLDDTSSTDIKGLNSSHMYYKGARQKKLA